ncbi:hypothetical protein HED60_10870 [Planctomycetales bacterium ZRK34]|nr:hypothetical protein HED60_10870 [Planctomycetales bacterium ZRK34]
MTRTRQLTPWVLTLALIAVALPLGLSNGLRADEDSPIAKEMEAINSNYKQLRRAARTKNFPDDTPKMLQEMQMATLKGMHMEVPLVKKMAASKQTEEMVAFKKMLKKQLVTLIDMEIAYMEGRVDDLAEGVSELGSIKSDGHDRFTED